MTNIHFGAFVPQGWKMELAGISGAEAKWNTAVEIAVLAEELGYDSLWVYDHFHNVPATAHEAVFECWTTMAAISQRTSRIRLGQMVGCAPYRNPGLLAKLTSCLDVISGGRRDYDEIRKTIASEVFIRETEKEIVDGGTRSMWGEPFDSWREGNFVGTPEQVSERIQTFIELGCTGFTPWTSDYPDTETLRLFA